jgi:hypothetical protein
MVVSQRQVKPAMQANQLFPLGQALLAHLAGVGKEHVQKIIPHGIYLAW